MLAKKERVISLLDASFQEMVLLKEMSKDILQPDDSTSFDPPLLRSCPTGALKGLCPLKLPLVGLRPPKIPGTGLFLLNNTFE